MFFNFMYFRVSIVMARMEVIKVVLLIILCIKPSHQGKYLSHVLRIDKGSLDSPLQLGTHIHSCRSCISMVYILRKRILFSIDDMFINQIEYSPSIHSKR